MKVQESAEDNLQAIELALKSQPFTDGDVVVEARTSCKDSEPLQVRKVGNGHEYFCNDDYR